MDLFEEADLLRNVPMFAKLSPSKLKLLAFTSQSLTYKDGEVLFRAGDPADYAYVIMDGAIDILIDTEGGEVVAGTLGKNDLVGELAVLTKSPRSATIRAKGRLVALCIRDDIFLKLLSDNPEVSLHVIRELSAKLIRTHKQLEEAERKLIHLELSRGDDPEPTPGDG